MPSRLPPRQWHCYFAAAAALYSSSAAQQQHSSSTALCRLHLSHTAELLYVAHSPSSILDDVSQGPIKATVSNTARRVALYPAGSSLHSCCCWLCLPSVLTAWLRSVHKTRRIVRTHENKYGHAESPGNRLIHSRREKKKL